MTGRVLFTRSSTSTAYWSKVEREWVSMMHVQYVCEKERARKVKENETCGKNTNSHSVHVLLSCNITVKTHLCISPLVVCKQLAPVEPEL